MNLRIIVSRICTGQLKEIYEQLFSNSYGIELVLLLFVFLFSLIGILSIKKIYKKRDNNNKNILIFQTILVSVTIICSVFIYVLIMPKNIQPIFPVWILTSNGSVPESQKTIYQNSDYQYKIGSMNKMGVPLNCSVFIKIRNISASVPDSALKTTSDLTPILNYTYLIMENEEHEFVFNFKVITAQNISGNKISLEVNEQRVVLDSETFKSQNETVTLYLQFIFEVWFYNEETNKYVFSGVWVSSPLLTYTMQDFYDSYNRR